MTAGSGAAEVHGARVPLPDELADRLVTAIAVGTYSPGECLPPERELARSLGVSRMTLRHALQRVAELGLIEARRGRGGGTFVAEASWEEIAPDVTRRTLEAELPRLRELFDYRCLVAGMIARAAAQRRTADEVTDLHAAAVAFRGASNMIQARAADHQLHATITLAARNAYLTAIDAQLTATATLGFGAEPFLAEFFDVAARQHEELAQHIARGDAEAAGQCAQDHYTLTLETMKASLNRALRRLS